MPRKRTNKKGLKRTVIVEIIVDKRIHDVLLSIANILAMAYNEINYMRRRLFFDKKLTPEAMRQTYNEVYRKYADEYKTADGHCLLGSDTLQAVLNLSDDNWRAFFMLLKEKEVLPSWFEVNPPGYSKSGKRRIPFIRLKSRQWELSGDTIIIKGVPAFGLRAVLKIKGGVHWSGERGELMLRYDIDGKKWYAYMQFYGTEKLYSDGWRTVPLPLPGSGIAGIDLGVNNLFAVYSITSDGRHVSALFNGRPLKSIWFYWKHKISMLQSLLSGLRTSRRFRLMHRKAKMQMKNYIDRQIRKLYRWLREHGIGTVLVGLPHDIVHREGNEFTERIWMYGYTLKRLKEVAEEEGIEIRFIPESYTSSTCPLHGRDCGKRILRGLFKCTKLGKVFNADLTAAYNILARGISITPSPRKRDRGNGLKTQPEAESKKCGSKPPRSGGNSRPLRRGGGQFVESIYHHKQLRF
ncbi:RNA-guided endonuclease InsQ/TnpB family protein [Stygiolobus azoricus]|uniref:Transposase n=1 Tax=Stygiolobus azoricus TaxID=41675 RepID=A0A650CRE8_9CREN|nr:RNA-guided endonuclease TnpB family protein [Stygiolobus azoricus]QGR20396.1 transposase [Stygiolobus azoricus]